MLRGKFLTLYTIYAAHNFTDLKQIPLCIRRKQTQCIHFPLTVEMLREHFSESTLHALQYNHILEMV